MPLRESRQSRQRFLYALIQVGVVQFVFAVVGEKVFQAGAHQLLVVGLVAERPPDQRRRPVSHVAGNHAVGQFGALHVPQGGIDRVHQVQAGINQRAVKIKDHQPDCMGIEWAIESDHG